jgi:drug/metabolite transporter (DMT)-like permease
VLLANGVAWILWLFVRKTLPAGTTGLASLANPVLGVLFSWMLLGEQPLLAEAVGMALIVGGLAVLALRGVLAERRSTGLSS